MAFLFAANILHIKKATNLLKLVAFDGAINTLYYRLGIIPRLVNCYPD